MTKFADGEIVQILPEYLKDSPEIQAISYAIHRQMERYMTYCQSIGVYAMVDTTTDSVLDMLALDLNTQYYDESLDIETKRKLIKGTLKWYMHSGTPSAVKELVAAVFGEGEVKEWFEYGDDPYYFKIVTNATLTPEINDTFSAMLERVKNVRSHIRAIDIHRTLEQPLYPGILVQPNYRPAAIIDGYQTGQEAALTVYGIAAGVSVSRPAAVIDGYSVSGAEVSGSIHSGTAEASTQHQAAVMESLIDTADTVTQELHSGAAATCTVKTAAVMEDLTDTADTVTQGLYSGAIAVSAVRQAAVTESLVYTAEAPTQAIAAGTAAVSSNYKSTINE